MSYYEKLNADIKQAMRDKDKQKRDTLRLVVTDLKNEQIKLGVVELSEDEGAAVLNRYVKKLENEIATYVKLGQPIEKQEVEKELILSYLPKRLNEEEIELIVKETIIDVGAESQKDFGKVMGALKSKFNNNADMGVVNKTVKKLLSN